MQVEPAVSLLATGSTAELRGISPEHALGLVATCEGEEKYVSSAIVIIVLNLFSQFYLQRREAEMPTRRYPLWTCKERNGKLPLF